MLLKIWIGLRGAIRWDGDAKVFVSYSPALKIYSQGRTEKEARNALTSAVTLFLTTCFERGILERALSEAGFTQTEPGASPSEYMAEFIAIQEAKFDEAFDLDVPIHLVAARHASRSRDEVECLP